MLLLYDYFSQYSNVSLTVSSISGHACQTTNTRLYRLCDLELGGLGKHIDLIAFCFQQEVATALLFLVSRGWRGGLCIVYRVVPMFDLQAQSCHLLLPLIGTQPLNRFFNNFFIAKVNILNSLYYDQCSWVVPYPLYHCLTPTNAL